VTPESAAPSPQLGLAFGGPTEPEASVATGPALPAGVNGDAAAEVLATLRALDPDDLSPRAALDLLARLTKKLASPV
jgi:hypothetical protein